MYLISYQLLISHDISSIYDIRQAISLGCGPNIPKTSIEVWGGIEELVDIAIELGRWEHEIS